MRESDSQKWLNWRLKVNPVRVAPETPNPLLARLRDDMALSDPDIRWDLVSRIQAEIANGTYDLENKWLQAEEQLFRTLEDTI